VEVLGPLGFVIPKEILDLTTGPTVPQVDRAAIEKAFPDLHSYQVDNVVKCLECRGRYLNADDMGLGKTFTTIASLAMLGWPTTIVVCLSSVLYNWQDEIELWGGKKAAVLPAQGVSPISICSFDYARANGERLAGQFECVVVDECQNIKNPKAGRTQGVQALARKAKYFLPLSGTPMLNRPIELWPTLNLIDPSGYNSIFQFGLRYADGKQKSVGRGKLVWDFNGASNQAELKQRLEPIMARHTKADSGVQLPEVIRTKLRVEYPAEIKHQMNEASRNIVAYLRETGGRWKGAEKAETLVLINQLRRLAGKGKVSHAIEQAVNLLEQDQAVVMYCQHRDIVQTCADALNEYRVGVITGDVPAVERKRLTDEFQSGSLDVMIITDAGGVGINLYRASHIITVERDWVPANEEQAESRLHRLGQKNTVNNWILVGGGFDTSLDRLIDSKRAIFRNLLGQDEVPTLLKDLIELEFGVELIE
jgi:SWI/SNF-related matrix-associated actin-dependent regulator 1 of chromatin subfamily A